MKEETDSEVSKNHYCLNANIVQVEEELRVLKLRKRLIDETLDSLIGELSEVDTKRIERLYSEANVLIPHIQKTYEETLEFHNEMLSEKMKFIKKNSYLPLSDDCDKLQARLKSLKLQEQKIEKV